MKPLAHSARPDRSPPVSAQEYADHVSAVIRGAVRRAEGIARFASPVDGLGLIAAVGSAAEFHDLGKLDPENQTVLAGSSRSPLPVRHEDAGVAHLLSCGTLDGSLAALLVHAHHRGLPLLNPATLVADLRFPEAREHTDALLSTYLGQHRDALGGAWPTEGRSPSAPPMPDGLTLLLRMALSCLVDADHSDTARNYGDASPEDGLPLRASERLRALDRYVERLAEEAGPSERTALRRAIYECCREADPTQPLRECDAVVGAGKTTAVMAHLLRAAEAKGLRRIVVVLPFTNIIDQSVETYRRCLTLPGEDPAQVVAAHHHRAEFADPEGRLATYLWRAPVVVTTAVQFFETLAGRRPARLRKLNELPGAAIFLDESHACLRTALWPTAWRWLRLLTDRWGCHLVLGSGSLNRIWTMPEIETEPVDVAPLVPTEVRASSEAAERGRIQFRTLPDPLRAAECVSWLSGLPGPRLVIVNTVQTAAALARRLARVPPTGRRSVEHLSTALTPRDRRETLSRVRARLSDPADRNWTLVATSCVEAGVDLSFRVGIRERASLSSLIQAGGRVNRHGEWRGAEVWDIRLVPDGEIIAHPEFDTSGRVLGRLFDEGSVGADACTLALRRELRSLGLVELNRSLDRAERARDFPEVARLFRVIDAETRTVVVDPTLDARLQRGGPLDRESLQQHSVQIWMDRIDRLSLQPYPDFPDLYSWGGRRYDRFLGYMADLLPLDP